MQAFKLSSFFEMAQSVNPPYQPVDSTAGIGDLCLSVRTYNRLRKMAINNLEQIARATPREFMAIDGFGKKCLFEIADTLEQFYSSLDPRHLSAFANVVELWRPYFSHPERVQIVPYDPNAQNSSREALEPFNPEQSSQAQILVENLTLSTRAGNVLKYMKVRTLNDLAQIHPRSLAESENCGRRTLIELGTLLKEYFASLPPSAMVFYRDTRASWLGYAKSILSAGSSSPALLPTHLQAHPVVKVIENTFERLGERRKSILTKRIGVRHGQSRKTLEAIGREFDLTRERVRQIVAAGLKLVLKNIKTHRSDVYPKVRAFIHTRSVASLDEIASAIPNVGSSKLYDSKACIRLLLFANPVEIHHLDPSGSVWVSKGITAAFNTKVLRTARTILNGIPMTCMEASVEIARSLQQFDDRQVDTIQKLLLNSRGRFRIEESPKGQIIHPVRQNSQDRRRGFIYNYIKEQGVPVHLQEIFSALQDAEPELIPDSSTRISAVHAVYGSLERDDRFAWAGSSTWGLREWGYASRGRSIGAAALEVLRACGVPLSTARIIKELSHLYRVSSQGVSVALKASEGITMERDADGLWRLI